MSSQHRVAFNRAMLYVMDLDRSIQFYSALGLECNHRDEEVTRMATRGGGTLVLHSREEASQMPSGGSRLYLETDNPEAVVESALSNGGEVIDPVILRPWGWKHGYVRDPDGWELSVYSRDEAVGGD